MTAFHNATIELLDTLVADEFFGYLRDHLSDNGQRGAYFQPMPAGSIFPPEKQQTFIKGLSIPVGAPDWRRIWIAHGLDRQIIGHIDLRGHPDRCTEHRCLLGMGVHRDHRERGLATRLLTHAERWAVLSTQLEWIDLNVLTMNCPALNLYRRIGFAKTGEIPEMFIIDGQRFGYTSMAKRLERLLPGSGQT